MFTPFRGLLFDPTRVSDVGAATSPPYDVISPDDREALLAGSEHNIARVLLCDPDDATYQRAAGIFDGWRAEGVLTGDDRRRYYLYEMDYSDADGNLHTARGVMGALELVELGDRVVGHEETMDKHRADRLAVLDATQANLDPIIALSSSPDLLPLLTAPWPPRLDFEAGGVRHRLYDIDDDEQTGEIGRVVDEHAVSIADGHHRYLTALGYRKTRNTVDGPGPWDHIMAMMSPAEGSGLTVGPYHRILPKAPADLDALQVAFEVHPAVADVPHHAGELVIAGDDGAHLLRPRPEALADLPPPYREASAAIAREVLYPLVGITEEDVDFVAHAEEAVAAATGGRAALLVAPVSEHAIAEAGEVGLRFPRKTTFFVPKPRAGLVIRSFETDRG
jgi:uncharacterized protein (DUF1015 family)